MVLKKKLTVRILIVLVVSLLTLYGVLFLILRAPVHGVNEKKLDILVNQNKLKQHVSFLASLNPSRSVHHPESLEKAAQYIFNEFNQMGYEVLKEKVPIEKLDTYNLVVKWIPKAIKEAGNRPWVIVGAHYDSHGKDNPGADDNASGVAGLIELARLFKENNPDFQFPVQFVAYTTEEPPYFAGKKMGSAIHAKSLVDNKQSVRLMYSLEMIGFFSEKQGSQSYNIKPLSLFYPSIGNFIGLVGGFNEYQTVRELKKSFFAIPGLETYSISAPAELEGVDFSDHRSYWPYGWKAIMVTDTAFLRNKNYHKSGDTADKLNYKKMAQVVAGVFNSILNLE